MTTDQYELLDLIYGQAVIIGCLVGLALCFAIHLLVKGRGN